MARKLGQYIRYFYRIWVKLIVIFGLQLMALIVALAVGLFFGSLIAPFLFWMLQLGVPVACTVYLFDFWRKRGAAYTDCLPRGFAGRYLPFFAPIIARLALALGVQLGGTRLFSDQSLFAFVGMGLPFLICIFQVIAAAACGIGFAQGLRRAGRAAARWPSAIAMVAVLLALCVGVVRLEQYNTRFLLSSRLTGAWFKNEIDYQLYRPFTPDNLTVKMEFAPSLQIDADYPRMDGATALYPVYAAMAETLYTGMDATTADEYVFCSTTPGAYSALIAGEVDLIFCAQPSSGQLAAAQEAGVELILVPVMQEAFVFFVNQNNPVETVTPEQIRQIYRREITNWRQVGGRNVEILPFQRPGDSGSQNIMLQEVMQSETMPPLSREELQSMGDIIVEVAEYRNAEGALGYSFRYYATVMNPSTGIRLLSVDGVAPTVENIRNGSYPFVSPAYLITTAEGLRNPHVQQIIDWLSTEEGTELIEKCGYVSFSQ